jgi:hypothetical protein
VSAEPIPGNLSDLVDLADPLGADMALGDDLDPAHRLTSGLGLLVLDLYRMLITDKGQLIDDPDYGLGVRRLLHRAMTPAEIAQAPKQIEAGMRQDERVLRVDVALVPGDDVYHWRLVIRGEAAPGPFELVAGIGDASTRLLAGTGLVEAE